VFVHGDFLLPGDWPCSIDIRARLNLASREAYLEFTELAMDGAQAGSCDEYSPPVQPVAGFHYKVPELPKLIVKEEIIDLPDISIGGSNLIAQQILKT